jgi:uncharacterized membrane protein
VASAATTASPLVNQGPDEYVAAMAEVRRTIVIDRPIDEVFAFFADVSNDPKWRGHGLKEISVHGPMEKGAHVHQKLTAGPLGATVTADMDVVVYEPPRALGFQVTTGPLRPRVDFAFAPTGAGTEVSFSIEAALTGVKKAVMGKMAQKNMADEAAALDNAKRVLES